MNGKVRALLPCKRYSGEFKQKGFRIPKRGWQKRLVSSCTDAREAAQEKGISDWLSMRQKRRAASNIREAEVLLRWLTDKEQERETSRDVVARRNEASRDVVARGRAASWRQRKSAHVAALQAQLDKIEARGLSPGNQQLADKAHSLLKAARDASEDRSFWAWLTGAAVDRASSNVHQAEVLLLQLTPDHELAWRGAVVLTQGRHHLGAEDPRLALLEGHLRENSFSLDKRFKDLAASVLYGANSVEETEISRVRSFRNILLLTFIATTIISGIFVLMGYREPAGIPAKLCFNPPNPLPNDLDNTKMVCPIGSTPSGGSLLLVAVVGMTAAALAGAASVRKIQGTSMPYMVPLGLLLLRLPIGALSAVLGLILIRGEFIPGLSALDNSAQIVGWAVVFGIGQESLTRMIDRQGNAVLENVKGSWRGFGTSSPVAPTPLVSMNGHDGAVVEPPG
ncbi:hypothetical protein [Streptomyces doebereineriae]|uniref:Uncharacterized protein n=1 Tax=Streptomyces doebereineriae TaxID=3075528 RepID=A0ABU2V5X2_9ACTN|nr:hypothetical protein [Streptomyces sp. DSM 41640]MDT0480960.1 hypothetical protein [Streptomyces sp. DSM 41640]